MLLISSDQGTQPLSPETLIAVQSKKPYNSNQPAKLTRPEPRFMNRAHFLKNIPLFADLSETDRQALAAELSHLQFKKGDAIFFEGDPGQTLYIVESGNVRIYLHTEDGQETSVNVCTSGDIFGELAVIDGLPRSASAIALEDSVVLALNREQFRECTRRYPQLAFNFLKALSVRVRYNTRQIDSLSAFRVPSRLARKLLELAQEHGVVEMGGVRIPLPLTQSDLASLIGTTRESINKALGNFRKQGLIRVQAGVITIVDPEALRALHM
jgi:CRP/FNR family transcriptional regulator, cyclic AMP receptor protein